MAAKVCAVLVTFNRLDTLKESLSRILSQTLPPTVVVVDNLSNDGTREYLDSIAADHQNLHCIFLNNNSGSAGGIAAGMRYGIARGQFDYFWILDDDTYYDVTALERLIAFIEPTDYAMLGQTGFLIRYGKKRSVSATDAIQQVDYTLIDGALIRADVVKQLGTTREGFFMMGDDHEYCLRLTKHGYKIGLIDIGAADRLYLGGTGAFTKATLWRGYYSARNHMAIVKDYFSVMNLVAYGIRQSKFLLAAAVLAPDRFTRVRFRLLGIWHGVRGVSGRTLDPKTLKFSNVKQTNPGKGVI